MKKRKNTNPVSKYLAAIGSKGGKARAAKHGKQKLREWAKLGGRPKKDVSQKSKDRKEVEL